MNHRTNNILDYTASKCYRAMLYSMARYMLWQCICQTVIKRCSTKMAERSITQTTPYDSPDNLVF